MKHLIKKLLRENLLLTENKLYGKKIIDGVTKKIGDSSDETLNKLAIAGLYRNIFGNIQQLKTKEQLDTLFKSWYDGTINKMVKTTEFVDDKATATKYLGAYIKNIKSLGDEARPFSFKKIEKGLVDLVNNSGWIKDNSIKQNNDIYNPKDDDVLFKNDEIIILDTDTKAKCVMYGKDESWCITEPTLNHYNTYRIRYGATPYFVLQKNVKGPEHKLVIMHYSDGYAIADRSNTGDRAGGNSYSKKEPWSYVEQQIPNLKGLEKFFPYREVTFEEETYAIIIERISTKIRNNETKSIENIIISSKKTINKELNISVSEVDIFRDVLSELDTISGELISKLSEDLIDVMVEQLYFVRNPEQIGELNDKQKRRNAKLKLIARVSVDLFDLDGIDSETQAKYLDDYIILAMLSGSDNLAEELKYLDKSVLSKFIKTFMNSLGVDSIEESLSESNDIGALFKVLSNSKEFILNKHSANFFSELYRRGSTEQVNSVADHIFKIKSYVENMSLNLFFDLLSNLSDINNFIANNLNLFKARVDRLEDESDDLVRYFGYILDGNENLYKNTDFLLTIPNLVLQELLPKRGGEYDNLAIALVNNSEYLNKVSIYELLTIMSNSKYYEKIIENVLSRGDKYIMSLDEYDIEDLINYSGEHPKLIRKLRSLKRIDKYNDVIA